MSEVPSTSPADPAPKPDIIVPAGFKLYTENQASILLPDNEDTFLNPVQEFNRDLSVACIRTWSEDLNAKNKLKWEEKIQRKAKPKAGPSGEGSHTTKKRREDPSTEKPDDAPMDVDPASVPAPTTETTEKETREKRPIQYRPQKFVVLEALSATGLRSIRYAKELPLVKYVIANDLSSAATAAMHRNVEINGLGPQPATTVPEASSSSAVPEPEAQNGARKPANELLGKVRVNHGDACTLMYSHRGEKDRVDVVDLDPYGTAAPFLDSAIQSVKDNGLLCVTCTDLSVLGNTNYPEKCFANYGGIPAKAEYCHEVALRLVLHALSTTAARYGRYITPLLSLSIDFYVRLFIRVRTAPIEVKKAMSHTAIYYICTGCQAYHAQPLGRVVEQEHKSGVNYLYKTCAGPPTDPRCGECGFTMQLAGPMWSGPLHDKEFVGKVLDHVEHLPTNYSTSARMKGMLTLAKEELDLPFYFTPARIASSFHAECPSLETIASALLNGNHTISRSHACPGSLKTTATRPEVHDIFRNWIKLHPIGRMDKIKDGSPARKLLEKEPQSETSFAKHPGVDAISKKIKLVRYQVNPRPNWGPKAKPDGGKRKRDEADAEAENEAEAEAEAEADEQDKP